MSTTNSKMCFFCCQIPKENVAYSISLTYIIMSVLLFIVLVLYIAGIPFGHDIDIFITHIPLAIILILILVYSIYVRLYPLFPIFYTPLAPYYNNSPLFLVIFINFSNNPKSLTSKHPQKRQGRWNLEVHKRHILVDSHFGRGLVLVHVGHYRVDGRQVGRAHYNHFWLPGHFENYHLHCHCGHLFLDVLSGAYSPESV